MQEKKYKQAASLVAFIAHEKEIRKKEICSACSLDRGWKAIKSESFRLLCAICV